MKIGSLFSGSGILDMAVEAVTGGRTVWHAEVDPAAAKVLALRYPDVPNLGDVTAVDWSRVEPVDVICGGSPCQDVSHAGKRAGMKAGTRSGLWASMVDAVDVLRPQIVMWENVRGVLGAKTDATREVVTLGPKGGRKVGYTNRAFGRVLGDLADLGYDARWVGLRAADVGAPHGRFRIFVVATDTERCRRPRRSPDAQRGEVGGVAPAGGRPVDWGRYSPAVQRWERVLGRVAPAPTEPGARGGQRLSPRFVEWMMGWPAGWVTDVPGVSRNDQLKILGNGVVPQQAQAALRWLLPVELAALEAA